MDILTRYETKTISGGKDLSNYYQDIIKPAIIVGAGGVAGLGGGLAATVAIYGIEGLVQAAPAAFNALDQMNRLSEPELQARMNDPYGYPD